MSPRDDHHDVLFHRHDRNPILTAADWPYPANSIFNPGVTRLSDGTTLLLCRVEDRRGHSHLTAARSHDGINDWEIDAAPTLPAAPEQHPEELWGIEDPRITYLDELDLYAVVYTAYSRCGPGVSLVMTEDFASFEHWGVVIAPENKDAAILPRKVDGRWVMVHRPVTSLGADMWLAYSPDLRHWGDHRMMMAARRGGWWDAKKIGLSTPLIETPRGWLMIYHGARVTVSGSLYRIGLALFDLEDPGVCLRRGSQWIFGPQEPYERAGDVGNVVFPCGFAIADDGDTLHIYYGAADTSICLATGSVSQMLEWLDREGLNGPERTTS